MVPTLLSIWIGSVAIGGAGAAAALSNRWVSVLGLNVVAGIYSIVLLGRLKGELAVALFRAGDVYVWLAMLGLIAMWVLLGIGESIAMWKQRGRPAAEPGR